MFGLRHDFLGTQASEIGDFQPVRGVFKHKDTKAQRHKNTGKDTKRLDTRLALISEAPRAYLGSAPCLFRKRPALIPEAPRAYFGGASS